MAIQHNLDWGWPYWVERQFNHDDPSFVPRAFSFSHINQTQRNRCDLGMTTGCKTPKQPQESRRNCPPAATIPC